MNVLAATIPVETITNPILLWLFRHGWEDPNWGHIPTNQVALGLALHDLSTRLANPELKDQLQHIAQKVVADNSQRALR